MKKRSGKELDSSIFPLRQAAWPFRSFLPAFWIAFIYLVVSLLWILLSDRVLFMMYQDTDTLVRISNYKGYAFVFASALLIWGLSFRAFRRMAGLNRDLTDAWKSEQRLGAELVRRNQDVEAAQELLVRKNEVLQRYHRDFRAMLYVDALTGLPNRRAMRRYLAHHVARIPVSPFALMYLDLDNFKLLNDVHGHSQGDAYLRALASRMRDCLPRGWRLFRMGGDEFVCCHAGTVQETQLAETARRLREACAAPILLEGVSLHGAVSLGIARYPEHGKTVDDLLKHADIAMYGAKRGGGNDSLQYSTDMSRSVARRFALESALMQALEQEEFSVFYQPQVSLETGRITGFEALIRWRNAELGMVSPAEFIPVAEESRHILPIGLWVFQNACCFLKELRADGFLDLDLSVNVSMVQLLQQNFVASLVDMATRNGVPPERVQLEITESILMESREQVLPVLHALRTHGFHISLDDFGQGYSSLSYLMSMPIEVLKIDKTFVDNIGLPGPGEAVLGAILVLGSHLRLHTVAEGVETEAQRAFLREHHCDCMQGYLFSRPVPQAEAKALLRAGDFRGSGESPRGTQ
jgi:diguanylate cyclase (GGDEF)-like protein